MVVIGSCVHSPTALSFITCRSSPACIVKNCTRQSVAFALDNKKFLCTKSVFVSRNMKPLSFRWARAEMQTLQVSFMIIICLDDDGRSFAAQFLSNTRFYDDGIYFFSSNFVKFDSSTNVTRDM